MNFSSQAQHTWQVICPKTHMLAVLTIVGKDHARRNNWESPAPYIGSQFLSGHFSPSLAHYFLPCCSALLMAGASLQSPGSGGGRETGLCMCPEI